MKHIYMITVVATIFLSACSMNVKYGLGLHPSVDSTNGTMTNPLFIMRIEKKVKTPLVDEINYEHASSLMKRDVGRGTNYVEFLKCINCNNNCE